MKILAFEGKHKLSDKWEEDPYLVLDQPNPDIPVFTVQKESGEGRKRNLHRNLLLPVGHLVETRPIPKRRRFPRKEPPKPAPRPTERLTEQESDYVESSDDELGVLWESKVEDDSDSTITGTKL